LAEFQSVRKLYIPVPRIEQHLLSFGALGADLENLSWLSLHLKASRANDRMYGGRSL
jgi:hypothetical protein